MTENFDALVLTAGTGGTITGVGEELKKRIPNLKIYVVGPKGWPVLYLGENLEHIKIPGTGPGFIPKILNRDIYDEILLIDDEDAQMMARRLSAEEGILVGASGAASAYFAVQVAKTFHLRREFFAWHQTQESAICLLTYFQVNLINKGRTFKNIYTIIAKKVPKESKILLGNLCFRNRAILQ